MELDVTWLGVVPATFGLAIGAAGIGSVRAVISARELVALRATLLQPAAEKAASYARAVYELAATTGSEVSRVVEATAAQGRARFLAAIDTAVTNAPAGSEQGVALFKSFVAAANNAIESAQKASRQATDVAQANYQSLTATAVRATKSKRAA
jgi:phasin family protein